MHWETVRGETSSSEPALELFEEEREMLLKVCKKKGIEEEFLAALLSYC